MKREEVERYLDLPSPAMREVVDLISRVAPLGTTVFINGPSGSGKEFAARAIHLMSPRATGPFIPVNCGAIPRDLLESELFGSEKGAFTGSVRTRAGLMESASGGTLFLDEIGDMPHEMQVKLLRVLEEQTFTRVGASQSIKVDVRFVCATHRDLDQLIEEQKFREDLYYRINVFPIVIPPLDERKDDIPRLIELILERFKRQGHRNIPKLTDCAVAALQSVPWPGNVRQLRNVIERAGVLYPDSDIDASIVPRLVRVPVPAAVAKAESSALWQAVGGLTSALPPRDLSMILPFELPPLGEGPIQASTTGDVDVKMVLNSREAFSLRDYMTEIETAFIRIALQDSEGSVSAAARRLGTQRTTLIEKMRKFSIQREDA